MTEHETSIFMTGVKTLNNRFHAALACYPSMASSVRTQWHPHCGRWVKTAQALATEPWPSCNPAFLVFKIFSFWVIAAQNKLFRVKLGESTPKKDSCRILGRVGEDLFFTISLKSTEWWMPHTRCQAEPPGPPIHTQCSSPVFTYREGQSPRLNVKKNWLFRRRQKEHKSLKTRKSDLRLWLLEMEGKLEPWYLNNTLPQWDLSNDSSSRQASMEGRKSHRVPPENKELQITSDNWEREN